MPISLAVFKDTSGTQPGSSADDVKLEDISRSVCQTKYKNNQRPMTPVTETFAGGQDCATAGQCCSGSHAIVTLTLTNKLKAENKKGITNEE